MEGRLIVMFLFLYLFLIGKCLMYLSLEEKKQYGRNSENKNDKNLSTKISRIWKRIRSNTEVVG